MKLFYCMMAVLFFVTAQAQEGTWVEVSRESRHVTVEFGYVEGPNLWCNMEVVPTLHLMNVPLSSNPVSNCQKLIRDLLELSRRQRGLQGVIEFVNRKRHIPGRICHPFEDCYRTAAREEIRTEVKLTLEGNLIFKGVTHRP